MLLLATLLVAQSGSVSSKLQSARELKQKGAAAEAAAAYEAVLPEVRKSGDAGVLAQALLEAGQSALAAGNYPRALGRGQEATSLFRKRRDLANEALASNLSGSAQLYSGNYSGALDHFRHALELDQKQHDARGEINRLNNIANAYFFQGRYLEALENYETGLRRAEENAHEPWGSSRRQLELTNLAILYEQLGQNQKALDYYKLALAGPSALNAAEHGQLLSNVGTLYRRMGDAVKALEMYREASALLEREHLSDAEIHVLQNVGIALALDLHDSRGASQAFSQALSKATGTGNRRETVLAHLFRGEAAVRTSEWQSASADFAAALEGAREIGATEEEWTALYGQARVQRHDGDSRAALETLRAAIAKIESVRAGLGASSLKADFLANKRDAYDAAIALMLDSGNRDAAVMFGLFEQARARNFRDALGWGTPPALQDVQTRLAPGALLLEYWMGPGRVAAVAISRDGATVLDGPLDDAPVRALPAALRGADWRGAVARIGRAVLRGVPRETRRLLIVPDGSLSLIPFETLPLESGRMAIEEMPVSYLPSAALLLRAPARATPAMPWRRQLLGLGDPAVDSPGAAPDDMRWSRLPQAASELKSIARALPGRAELHLNGDDRKEYLAEGAPLVHLATHAVADTVDASRSRILFTREAGRAGSEYLFRNEVASLPLAGTDLVTLSACDTEAGPMARGEGVQSFSRAFLAAGARATVTTLWRVEDRATAEFMKIFYDNLAHGEAKAEALRNAKLQFLRLGGPHAQPLYWSAFVLNGDGQEPIPPVVSWAWIAAAAFGAVVLLTGCRYLYSRRRYHHSRRHHHPTA